MSYNPEVLYVLHEIHVCPTEMMNVSNNFERKFSELPLQVLAKLKDLSILFSVAGIETKVVKRIY